MKDLPVQIVRTLQAAGETGLRIDELATRLSTQPQEIEATISKLIEEGLVMQKQESDGERYVASGTLVDSGESAGLGDLNGCPCFHCLRISRCGVRQPDSPVQCRELEDWTLTDTA